MRNLFMTMMRRGGYIDGRRHLLEIENQAEVRKSVGGAPRFGIFKTLAEAGVFHPHGGAPDAGNMMAFIPGKDFLPGGVRGD